MVGRPAPGTGRPAARRVAIALAVLVVPLVVDTEDSLLTVDGTIDRSKETLGLQLRALIQLKGRFADPTVSVDRAGLAGRLIASAALGALLTPLAALPPLLEFGEGDVPSPCRERLAAPQAGPSRGPGR